MRLTWQRQARQLIAPPCQDGFDDTVNQQIGVATNRAGEMGVSRIGQPKVATVERGVNGLLHRAQQHRMNLLRVWPIFTGLCNGLKLTRTGVIAQTGRHTHGLEVVAKGLAFFRCGALMHPENSRVFGLQNKVSTTDIGSQHGLFDQAMRLGTNSGNNLFNTTAFVTNNLRFCGFKIYSASFLSAFEQAAVDIVKMDEVLNPVFVLGSLRASGVGENGGYIGIGEPRMTVHHRLVKLICKNLSVLVNQHVADHAKPINQWIERAQTVRQFFGQHGNDTARKIHTCGAFVGVYIDRATGINVIADVCNSNQ